MKWPWVGPSAGLCEEVLGTQFECPHLLKCFHVLFSGGGGAGATRLIGTSCRR